MNAFCTRWDEMRGRRSLLASFSPNFISFWLEGRFWTVQAAWLITSSFPIFFVRNRRIERGCCLQQFPPLVLRPYKVCSLACSWIYRLTCVEFSSRTVQRTFSAAGEHRMRMAVRLVPNGSPPLVLKANEVSSSLQYTSVTFH